MKLPYLVVLTVAVGVVFNITSTQGLNASPSTTITTFNAGEHNLAATGKTRLISFYSPDCPVSQRDVEGLGQLHQQFSSEQQFDVIAVAMPYDTTDKVNEFQQTQNIDYAMAHDTDGSISAAFPRVRFTPTTFLIDSDGKIVWRHTGRMRVNTVSEKIAALLD